MTAPRRRWTLGRVARGLGRRTPLRPLRILFPFAPWRQVFRLWLATIRSQPDRRKALIELVLAADDATAALDRGALDYGGGVHPKHRLTGYHDIFVERIAAGERVLDVGCGIGSVAHDIAVRAEAEVVGIDTSPWSLDVARRRFSHPRVTYLQADALGYVPEQPVDVAVLSNVLEHIAPRLELLAALVVLDLRHAPRAAILAVVLIVGGAAWNEYRKSEATAAAQRLGDGIMTAVDLPAATQQPEEVAQPRDNGAEQDDASLCPKCQTKAVIVMDGCLTCLNCGESKCG